MTTSCPVGQRNGNALVQQFGPQWGNQPC